MTFSQPSTRAAYAPNSLENFSPEEVLRKMNDAVLFLRDDLQSSGKKLIATLREKLESGKTLSEIKNSLSPLAKNIFAKLSPTSQEVQEEGSVKLADTVNTLEHDKKEAVKKSLGEIEKAGFLEETWEKIKEVTGRVVDGGFAVLQKIPKQYLVVGAGLLLLLGSVSAVVAFLQLGQGISSTATFGALQSLLGIDPATISAATEPLLETFGESAMAAGLPA